MFKHSFSTKKCIFRGVYNSHLNISSGCFLRVISTSRAHSATGKEISPFFFGSTRSKLQNGKPGQRMKWKCEDFCSKLQKGVIDSVVKKSSNKRTWLQRQMQEPPNKNETCSKFPPCFFTCFQQDIVICVFFTFRFKKAAKNVGRCLKSQGLPVAQKGSTAGRR